MHKLPYERFVQALIIHKEPPAKIIDILKSMDFVIPANMIALCKEIYTKLFVEEPEHFQNSSSEPKNNWLLDLGIHGLYHEFFRTGTETKSAFKGAQRILEDPRMRRAIQSMALIKITDEDIELLLNARYDFNFTPDEINFFLDNYFDVLDWTLPQIKTVVDIEPNREFKEMYLLALKGDKNYLFWKLGLNPNKSYQEMLQDMMNDAYYLFKENSRPGKSSDLALKWSSIAIKVAEKLEKSQKDDDDALNLFQTIELNLNPPDTGRLLKVEDIEPGELPEFEHRSETMNFPKANTKKLNEGTL